MSVLEGPLVFVDIETTGMSYSRGRVIEVAAIRLEAGKITETFSSLVDPETELPMFITSLTGISNQDLQRAPTFYDIADELMSVMDGALFIAHNVRFDYGFLKHEFSRCGKNFNPKQLCTVRLSKALYPDVRGHKLQDLIDRCGILVQSRHRAYDDAKAMLRFIQHAQQSFPAETLEAAIKQQVKSPSLPKNLDSKTIYQLPESPGVYIFEDDKGVPLYIGKSVNIKKRILSHFSSDHQYDSEFKISQQVHNVSTQTTAGELEALLLESALIKDLQPLYNRQLRRRQKMTIARRKDIEGGFIGLDIEDIAKINPEDISNILGVYSSRGRAKDFINQIIKDFRLCPKLMGLEKSSGSCFLYQLRKCSGACAGYEPAEQYNARLLSAFEGRRLQEWPYRTPVIIEESNDNNVSSIVVDQWCVLADISIQPDCDPVVKFRDKVFDIDTYKILRSYLLNKPHKLNIRPIALERVYAMAKLPG